MLTQIIGLITGKYNSLRVGNGYSDASRFERSLKNYRASIGSPDGEIVYDLPILRQRSRDLYRNNAIGRGAISLMVGGVVGRGLRMQCAMEREVIAAHNGWTPDQTSAFFNQLESDVERKFRWWAESAECDARDQFDFYELQRLAYTSVLASGDVFLTLPIRQHRRAPFRLRVGLIEADQVEMPLGGTSNQYHRAGVQTTFDAVPLGYWVNLNQEVYPEQFVYVPKYGKESGRQLVYHIFRADRPGQSRGVPFLAPVIKVIKTADSYKKSELDAALVSSFFSVFVKSSNPDALASNGIVGQYGAQTAEDAQLQGIDYNLAPAAIMQLMPGEDVAFANPTRPNTGFDAFMQSLYREVGMALNIPYEMLIRHFSSSYSASRAARIEYEKTILADRQWLEFAMCQPVYREWFTEEVLAGRISAPGFFDDPEIEAAYLNASWMGESMGQLDPTKEVTAAAMRVQYGFSTATEETAAMTGSDYSRNVVILQREQELRKQNEIPTPADWQGTPVMPQPVDTQQDTQEVDNATVTD